MPAVAVDAGHLASRRASSVASGCLRVQLFSSWQRRQASARATGSPALKLKIKPGLSALGFQVAAGRPVTTFARVATMHVFRKRLGVRFVAGRTQRRHR